MRRALVRRANRLLLGAVCLFTQAAAFADDACLYVDAHGNIVQARSLLLVPAEYRSRAVCKEIQPDEIAAPSQVELGNESRTAQFATDLGPMRVRWPRSIERCFSSSPSRAVGDAAIGVNRAIKSGRFTSELKQVHREWDLVFTDKATALAQFPVALTVGGHPGFMISPNRIYIITDFVAPDCSGARVGDEVLAQVLLHEMGHVLEYLLLGERSSDSDRQRAEGFAAWFEQYSADFTTGIPRGQVSEYYSQLATQALQDGPGGFTGTAQDYAYAALQFKAIVKRRGVSGLMQVYQVMRESRLPFYDAVQRAIGWNRKTLEREMREVAS